MEPIRADRPGLTGRRARKRAAAEPGGFFEHLRAEPDVSADQAQAAEASGAAGRLPDHIDSSTTELFDAVHQAGERLARERSYTAAQRYREAVSRFLARVIPGANRVEIHESGHDILNRKQYFLLTEVNRAVDRLVQGLLSSQREQLDALARLEEVEGLLVDLVQ